jgi:hypothetical protein
MGITICETHGENGIGLVSPMLQSASRENRRIPRNQIVAVRFSLLDEYPPSIAWLDSDTAARLEVPVDRTLELEDVEALDVDLEPVCGKCFDDWLRFNGVDTSPSPDEKRFMHLADQLQGLTWSTLQPAFNAVADAVRQAVHPAFVQTVGSFGCTKEKPFAASLTFIASGNLNDDGDLTVYAACRDRFAFLQCECGIHFKDPMRATLEGPHVDVAVDPDGLAQADLDRILAQTDLDRINEWAARVAAFVTTHRGSIVEEVLKARRAPSP